MATNTYVALDKTTTSSSATSITLSAISGSYTDLVLVANHKWSGTRTSLCMQFNSDTNVANYSDTGLYGNGTSATSGRETGNGYNFCGLTSNQWQATIFQFQNYSNTTTYKTSLSRGNSLGTTAAQDVNAMVHLWKSTAAITSIKIYPVSGNFIDGSTFTLYGVLAEGGAKATGGVVTSDSTYYYHTFLASGTFTPVSTLSCDVLVVAGGGGGGGTGGGGGGAGGYQLFTSQSTSSATTITVGGGGNGSAGSGNGVNGTTSQFAALTASAGGGWGGGNNGTGATGGSGGGGSSSGSGVAGGAGTSGQGFAGSAGVSVSQRVSGGGGGAGGAAATATDTPATLSTGGVGSSSASSWGLATGRGENVSGTYYFAGGGGGSIQYNSTTLTGGFGGGGRGGSSATAGLAGTANTGGGGGGSFNGGVAGAAGGSGIVIIRYAK
jgi:hypothetical protein